MDWLFGNGMDSWVMALWVLLLPFALVVAALLGLNQKLKGKK